MLKVEDVFILGGRPGGPCLPSLPAQRGEGRFRLRVLLQVTVACVPAAALFALGHHSVAGHWFWGLLAVFAARLVLLKKPNELLCVVLGVIPVMNMLRGLGFAFYNIIVPLLGGVLVFYFICFPGVLRDVARRNPMVILPVGFVGLYYLASAVGTQSYSTNLRLFDCVLAMVGVVLISRRAHHLKVFFLALMISGCAVAICFVQQLRSGSGDRLGSLMLDGMAVGNPVAIGTPLALGFLVLVMDRGYWLNWRRQPALRLGWLLPATMLLGLSTSRAAWAVALGGVVISLVLGQRQRVKLVFMLALGIVALKLVLLSPYGLTLQKAMDRTFDPDRSAANRTSGRSDQWAVFAVAFTDSARHLLIGHGPGAATRLYAEYAERVADVRVTQWVLHSLFMQVGAELGLLGLLPMLGWMGVALFKALSWSRQRRLLLPLACFAGYVFIVLTVSGNDTVSGAFMGVGLLPTLRWTERKGVQLEPWGTGGSKSAGEDLQRLRAAG